MNLLKIVTIFFYFLRAMIFENKREWDWQSPDFDIRKILLMILLVQSFTLNIVVIRSNILLHKQRAILQKLLKDNNIVIPAPEVKKKENSKD